MAETKVFGTMKNAIVTTTKNIVADQSARLKNVVDVYKSVLTGKGAQVVKSSGSEKLDQLVSSAASHPFISAGIIASAVNPAAALAALKQGGSKIATEYGQSKLGTKVALGVAAPVVAGALMSSQKVRSEVVNLPSTLTEFGADIGNAIDNPSLSSLGQIVKDNPVASSVAAAGILGVAGLGAASLISNVANTQAVKANTKATKQAIESLTQTNTLLPDAVVALPAEKSLQSSAMTEEVPITPATQVLGKSAGSLTARKRKRKQARDMPSQIMRVAIYNQSKHLNTYAYSY